MIARRVAFIALVSAVLGAPVLAGPLPSDPVYYFLTPSSEFETGCFGTCLCPVLVRGLQGTFVLRYLGSDPLFDNYAVQDVRWSTVEANSGTTVAITGSGTYKVGGEFAVQQQMSLDLSVNGSVPWHFDSGLVLGGGTFPDIAIDISLHQDTACIDTVMHVDAVDPVVSGVGTRPGAAAFVGEAAPNPFRDHTDIQLYLGRSGPLEVTVYDVVGRAVRHLLRETEGSPGEHLATWDGRSDQGSVCSAGVYFVGVRLGMEKAVKRIVKLE